jgi:hypothetical protein
MLSWLLFALRRRHQGLGPHGPVLQLIDCFFCGPAHTILSQELSCLVAKFEKSYDNWGMTDGLEFQRFLSAYHGHFEQTKHCMHGGFIGSLSHALLEHVLDQRMMAIMVVTSIRPSLMYMHTD